MNYKPQTLSRNAEPAEGPRWFGVFVIFEKASKSTHMTVYVQHNPYGVAKYAGVQMTMEEFLRWESDDNYVYEFNNGTLEPTTTLKQNEAFILNNLENRFFDTEAFQAGGRLRGEIDVLVSATQMRHPDISYFTKGQFTDMVAGKNAVPTFAIELISEYDDIRKYIRKLHEYFNAGMQVVWLVFPEEREVYVYTSPKQVVICSDNDLLSAAPALRDFQLTVAELFA
jgi:Uma2 family endonuclease